MKIKKGYENKAEEAKKLRKLGLSQRDISLKLGISASAARNYTKDIKLTNEQEEKLNHKRRGTQEFCSYPGCKRKYCAKGLCNGHWAQQKRRGKLTPLVTQETKEERFWRYVEKPLNEKEDCWLWIGAPTGTGYGKMYHKGKHQLAHRLSYNIHKGNIEEGMQLDHLCRNRLCVNPYHLEIVTDIENLRRMKFYHNILNEINRLRNFVQKLGGDPGANIFTSSKLYGNSKNSGHEETL